MFLGNVMDITDGVWKRRNNRPTTSSTQSKDILLMQVTISTPPLALVGENLSNERMSIDSNAHTLVALWGTTIDRSSLESEPDSSVILESDISAITKSTISNMIIGWHFRSLFKEVIFQNCHFAGGMTSMWNEDSTYLRKIFDYGEGFSFTPVGYLNKCEFNSCTFDDYQITGLDATGSQFKKCVFKGNMLLMACSLDGIDFSGVIHYPDSGVLFFSHCSMRGCDLRGLDLKRCRFDGCDLKGIDFSTLDVSDLTFVGCRFEPEQKVYLMGRQCKILEYIIPPLGEFENLAQQSLFLQAKNLTKEINTSDDNKRRPDRHEVLHLMRWPEKEPVYSPAAEQDVALLQILFETCETSFGEKIGALRSNDESSIATRNDFFNSQGNLNTSLVEKSAIRAAQWLEQYGFLPHKVFANDNTNYGHLPPFNNKHTPDLYLVKQFKSLLTLNLLISVDPIFSNNDLLKKARLFHVLTLEKTDVTREASQKAILDVVSQTDVAELKESLSSTYDSAPSYSDNDLLAAIKIHQTDLEALPNMLSPDLIEAFRQFFDACVIRLTVEREKRPKCLETLPYFGASIKEDKLSISIPPEDLVTQAKAAEGMLYLLIKNSPLRD